MQVNLSEYSLFSFAKLSMQCIDMNVTLDCSNTNPVMEKTILNYVIEALCILYVPFAILFDHILMYFVEYFVHIYLEAIIIFPKHYLLF